MYFESSNVSTKIVNVGNETGKAFDQRSYRTKGMVYTTDHVDVIRYKCY